MKTEAHSFITNTLQELYADGRSVLGTKHIAPLLGISKSVAMLDQIVAAPAPQQSDVVEGIKRLTRERDRFERRLQRAVRIIKEQEGLNSALRSEMNRLHTERDELERENMILRGKLAEANA